MVMLNRGCIAAACLPMNNYWTTNERKWKRDWPAKRALQFGAHSRAKRGNISAPDEPTYAGVQNRGMLTGKFFPQVHAPSLYFLLSLLVTRHRSGGLSPVMFSEATKFFHDVYRLYQSDTIYICSDYKLSTINHAEENRFKLLNYL